MYIFFTGASLKISRDLIRAAGMNQCWALFLEKSQGGIAKEKLLQEILGLSACNLAQTMKETLAGREIDAEDRQDLLDDYIMENLRLQDWITLRDGAERMGKCQEIEAVWERLRPHFSRTREAQGLKPYPEAVGDVMRRLRADGNQPLREALLEFLESQHRLFSHYFRTLLEPFSWQEESPAETDEEDLPAGTNLLLQPDAPAEPPVAVEPPVGARPQAVAEPPVEARPPVTALIKASMGLPARVEPKALMEVKAPTEVKAPMEAKASMEAKTPVEIPPAEPDPSFKETEEEKADASPSPAPERLPETFEVSTPDPTDRLSEPTGMEDSPLLEGVEREAAAPLPEPLPETFSPAEAAGTAEPLGEPELLKAPVPEKETAPGVEPPVQTPEPLPERHSGFAYTVDPKKLAKVLEVLLAIDPTIDIKPIPPDRFPGHPPPKKPSPFMEGPPEPPVADAS